MLPLSACNSVLSDILPHGAGSLLVKLAKGVRDRYDERFVARWARIALQCLRWVGTPFPVSSYELTYFQNVHLIDGVLVAAHKDCE